MFYLFADGAAELPAWLNHVMALWPVWSALAVGLAALFGYRIFEKANINATNQANIDALEGLIETRDKEIAELRAERSELQTRHEILESEYKTLAGLVIAELLHWAGNFEKHRAELLQKDSEIRILTTRIQIMEAREAENAAIHKTGP